MSYESDRWAHLSPTFRAAHNRLRRARGQEPIPEPKIDLYVPPRAPAAKPFDPSDREFLAAMRQFSGGAIPGAHAQGEGFSINQVQVSFSLNDEERAQALVARQAQRERGQRTVGVEEGFTINRRAVR